MSVVEDMSSGVTATDPSPGLTATLSDIRFAWKADGPRVLDIERLEIETGERLFIGGPSGSGKTTLLGLFAGILVPQQGAVELLGTPLNHMNGAQRDRLRAARLLHTGSGPVCSANLVSAE